MPNPICHITRDDRGGRLRAVRLLAQHTDDSWHAPQRQSVDHAAPAEPARAAAAWIAQRLAAVNRRRKSITALCLDTDGAVCSWVSTPTADPAILRATIERDAGLPADDPFAEHDLAGPSRFPDLPGEIGYQPLDAATRTAGDNGSPATRTPVLAVPDASARLLLDELDRRGIRVGRVISIWHAMALAWDPANQAHAGSLRADRVVADSEQTTACVLLDGLSGRIIWSWSQGGRLLAGGSIRARAVEHAPPRDQGASSIIEGSAPPPALAVGPPEVARLTADWLSWSAQTALTPGRIVVVGSPAQHSDDAFDAGSLAMALAHNWDGASIDGLDEPDAIGATLRRLGEHDTHHTGAPDTLAALTHAPGRTHRSMFRWSALALLIAAAALAGIGWQLNKQARTHRGQLSAISTARMDLLRQIDPAIGASPNPLASLQNRVDEARMRMQPAADPDPRRPVLEAFDMLSYVLAAPEIELRQIRVDAMAISLRAVVPDVTTFEALGLALNRIDGPRLRWSEPAPRPMGREGKLDVTWTGTWAQAGEGDQ